MSHSEHVTKSTERGHGDGAVHVVPGKGKEPDETRAAEPEVEPVDPGPDKEPPTRPT